jgi:hypothetical protein
VLPLANDLKTSFPQGTHRSLVRDAGELGH